jgi:hypothetical protein
MYLCYIDESGNRDPRLKISLKDGSFKEGDWLYVLTALCIFEQRWHTLEKPINRHKLGLIEKIKHEKNIVLQLADCEIKSNWLRQPKEREKHLFLQHLSASELTGLTDCFFDRLDPIHATVFSVLVDKRILPAGTSQNDIHVWSWEQLLEMIEGFMRARHNKHQAIMINDDVSLQMNRMLAMSHAALLDKGTRRDTWLRHICEMPMFVRSELSAGVQLADLCSYNIYRAFKSGDLSYDYFKRVAPFIWPGRDRAAHRLPLPGIVVLDGQNSPLVQLASQFKKEQALAFSSQSL